MTNVAAPLTTSLSAAWLRSAGRGEAGILWHEFFDALSLGDSSAIQLQITKLLSIGHTSGADALAGFIAFISFKEYTNLMSFLNTFTDNVRKYPNKIALNLLTRRFNPPMQNYEVGQPVGT